MEKRHFDVVVVGNVGIDTNVYLAGADIDFSVESNFTENLDYVGQAGGYSSRGFARLGKRTAFVGYVGDDYSGRFVRETLAGDGIDTSGLFVDPAGTSRSVNVMYRDGRRKNFYDGKGHMQLQPDLDICQAILSQASFAHFNIPNWARRLLPLAKNEGLTISCDIQDVVSPDDPYRQDFIAASDILFCSAVNHPDPEPLIRQFLQRKPEQVVVVGMGPKGCALGIKEGIRFFGPVEIEAPVIDTNGAGDGLAVGFLSSYLLDRYSLEDSILRGQIAARFSCALKADSSNLITASQLDGFYNGQKGTG
ncbi:MAG: carbohydrate kinase family protein [Candidatus Promineifilaceae bacterium]